MDVLLWTSVLVPAALAVAVRLSGPSAGRVAVAAALLALGPAVVIVALAANGFDGETHFEWLPGGGLEIGLRLDGLSAAMSALVAGAGLAVLIHARGYFAASERAPQALAALIAFLAAMQGLVLATNLLTLLIFWELVGALSARLIAYERDDPGAGPGAIRAFLTTRSADLGLYAAVAALHAGSGTIAFEASRPEGFLGLLVGLGLVLAAAGKSAQLPFQTWLSGAMAGPTPVSALLHSATMVAAGVYLLVRAQELLAGWPLELAAWLGAITAVAAAVFALAQRDLKLILASSTTSQLGLMFVAAGAGFPGAAIFQLIAHAAGKAGMFLASGLFQRRRGGTSLRRLAGVGRDDPLGFWGFVIGAASIAAVPPLAVFWSKDAVLVAAEEQPAWFVLVLVASAGTVAYLLRPALILRRGKQEPNSDPPGRGAMLAGVFLLAAGSLTLGAIHTPLAELIGEPIPAPSAFSIGASVAALAAGAGLLLSGLSAGPAIVSAAREQLYTNRLLAGAVQRPLLRLAAAAGRVDDGIDSSVDHLGRTVLGIARGAGVVDRGADERLIDGAGRATVSGARGSDWVERRGVDAAVDGLARLIAAGGGELPRLQGGQLYGYLRNTAAGIVLLLVIFAVLAIA